jgi:hypothetical protein
MNIVGEGFPEFVTEQVNQRQKTLGSINKSNEQLIWLNGKTGWVRMASSVDLKEKFTNIPNYSESELARNFILRGGVEYQSSEGEGGSELLPSFTKFNKRSGIWPGGETTADNYAYGIGGLDFGLRPMPGILSAEIKTETRGSLKTATVQITAYNKQQFDIIDLLYLRLGYSMLLEWGHGAFYDNKGEFQKDNTYSLTAEFLAGQMDYSNYLEKIQTKRKASSGNYSAIVGKVVNFNWTFNKDLSYTITVTLRSMGDVIESLKSNILLPKTTSPSPNTNPTTNPTEETDPFKIFAEQHEIGKFFNLSKERLDESGSNATITSIDPKQTGYSDDRKSVTFYKKYYVGGATQYYIKLARFLSFLEENIIPFVDNVNVRLIEFDNKVEDNIIYHIPYQISANPQICNFKTTIKINDVDYKFMEFGDEFIETTSSNTQYGYLMNMYINMAYINNQIDVLKDKDGKVSIYSLLNTICQGINTSTGHINKIEPTFNNETGKVVFIDQTSLPQRDDILKGLGKVTTPTTFNVYKLKENNGSFIRDFNFNTTITNNLATMITVGATSRGYVLGEDATALSRMNLGLEDRFKKTIENTNNPFRPIPTTFIPANFVAGINNPELQYDKIKYYIEFVKNLGTTQANPPVYSENQIKNFSDHQTQIYEYFQNLNTETKIQESPQLPTTKFQSSPTITGFLPFDLQLTMDGLAGFKVYQKYTINSDFLPSNYPDSLEFIVKGIIDKISNNEWLTTVESIAIPKNPVGVDSSYNLTNGIININSTELFKGSVPATEGELNDFFRDVLDRLRISSNLPNILDIERKRNINLFFRIWKQWEASEAAWNPLNTTLITTGSTPYSQTKNPRIFVQNYPTREIGIQATVATLKTKPGIITAIKKIDKNKDSINQAILAVNSSDWGTKINPPDYTKTTNFKNLMYKDPIVPR